jgi:hypothetical protein
MLNTRVLTRKQSVQEFILHQEDSFFSIGQLSCQSGLAGCHLPAKENQLRRAAHTHECLTATANNAIPPRS